MAKKLISMLLSVLLVFGASITCFATDSNPPDSFVEANPTEQSTENAAPEPTAPPDNSIRVDFDDGGALARFFNWLWNIINDWLFDDGSTQPSDPSNATQPEPKPVKAHFTFTNGENGYTFLGVIEDLVNLSLSILA